MKEPRRESASSHLSVSGVFMVPAFQPQSHWFTGHVPAPPPPPGRSCLCCYLIKPLLCNNPIKGIDPSLGLIRSTLSGKEVVCWVGRGMVRALAAGGDAVKPSGKSSAELHQHALPQERKIVRKLSEFLQA